MSERNKPHNGRDKDGQRKVRQEDVEDLVTDPNGEDYLRDDVRLGGAVADIGAHAGDRAREIAEMIEMNKEDVKKVAEG